MTLSYISNAFYGGNFNAEHLAILALFHDYPETVTGDSISPIHYNSNVAKGFEKLEEAIMENLVGQIPEPLKKNSFYINSQKEDEKTLKLLKAADKISALLKCLKEILMDLLKLKILLITELPYDEIIKKENWDGKWNCIFKKNRVESLRPS